MMSDRDASHLDIDTGVDIGSSPEDSSTSASGNESEDILSENSENEIEDDSFVSKEEDNCLRYFLGIGIAEKAVRMWFNTLIPSDKLENHLKKHEKKLRKKCNDEQLSNIFPGNRLATSTTFDISLLYKLIRNSTNVKKPRNDWGETPDPADIEPADDLERVRISRNSLCHGTQSINDYEFEKKWKELKEIITRLAGGQLDGEIDSLKNKDLDHSARSSVKRSLAVLTERVQHVEKYVDDHIPKNIREQYQKELQKWREVDKLFWKTPAYQSVRDKIKSLPYVTVTGSGGTGKTFLIRHISLELAQEGFEIIPVTSFEKIILYGKLNIKQLFMVDDVLGVHSLNMSLYDNLIRECENAFSLLESGSKLLMSCRSVVFNESKPLNSFVTDVKHVINLDDKENELNDEDIKNILDKHCKYKKVREMYFTDLKLPRQLPMFPLLCRLFSSDERYQAMGEHFFLSPYQCIFSELDKMRELNKMHYAGLVYCVIKDNSVNPKSLDKKSLKDIYDCCRLNRSTSNSELTHSMQVLKGSYLMQDIAGRYSFIHDNLFELVAVHFGRRFQDYLIKLCTSSSIYKLLTLGDEGSISSENLIPVVEDHFPVLVDRVICDIKSSILYEVFSSIGLLTQNELFVSAFCRNLGKFSYYEVKQLFFDVQSCERLEKKTEKLVLEMDKKFDKMLETRKMSAIDFRFSLLKRCHARVVNWIIAYNHVSLLSGLIEIVREKSQLVKGEVCVSDNISQDIVGVIFGNDLDSQSVCFNLACSSRSLKMVELVLRHVKPECINHIDDDSVNEIDSWSLALASSSGCNDIVNLLLKKGADVNLCDEDKRSCLHYSCLFGHCDVVETLIKEGANVNLCSEEKGHSPLLWASLIGNVHVIELLIKNGADVNLCDKDGMSPLDHASSFGILDVIKCLLNSDADVNIDVNYLSIACYYGHCNIVEYLIDKVVDINAVDNDGECAIHCAARSGHLDIVEYLVEHGANINLLNCNRDNPLYCATKNGQSEVIKYLVEHGADVNKALCGDINTSPICCASSNGYLEIVKELIKLGADVNICDVNAESPLCYASKSGHLEIVKFLLQNDADINIGVSCLSSACESGHLDVVKYLIEKVDVNKVFDSCDPALHCACGQGHINIVKYLVEHGAKINLLNSSNENPLYCAKKNKQLDVIQYLVQHGADINHGLSDDRKMSPLCCACS